MRARASGVNKRLMGISFSGPPCPPCEQRWKVKDGKSSVGFVTSAVWSPAIEENIGFVMLNKTHWDPGTKVHVDIFGDQRVGKANDLPFRVPALLNEEG